MVVRAAPSPIRVRPWRGRTDTAECIAAPHGSVVTPADVRVAVDRAADGGFARVVTPAIAPHDWRPYLDAGFDIRERLHLLAHDLLDLPDLPVEATPTRLRRVGRRDLDRVLAVDHAAFEPFWRLDGPGLEEAADATPSSRWRTDRDVRSYALFGRAGGRGYVQRLGVRPDAQGQGLGSALVIDGLRWLQRWRVAEALVNTQESNERAVALYERLGFRRRPTGLAVLEVELPRP